jgi:hypothetical protein
MRPASDLFRAEQARIQGRLSELEAAAGSLPGLLPAEGRDVFRGIVRVLEQEVVPHLAWEEAHLYALCDGLAGNNLDRFTAVLRHQHRLLEGWIGGLARLLEEDAPLHALRRELDRLLGLLAGHLDSEETVLLDTIDRWFTADQLEVLLARPDAS